MLVTFFSFAINRSRWSVLRRQTPVCKNRSGCCFTLNAASFSNRLGLLLLEQTLHTANPTLGRQWQWPPGKHKLVSLCSAADWRPLTEPCIFDPCHSARDGWTWRFGSWSNSDLLRCMSGASAATQQPASFHMHKAHTALPILSILWTYFKCQAILASGTTKTKIWCPVDACQWNGFQNYA